MADTRLPFRSNLAFDRTSQAYIPFPTQTDAMLASLILAYRLASPILAVVLALVRHPEFRPGEITLQKPDDVWRWVAEYEAGGGGGVGVGEGEGEGEGGDEKEREGEKEKENGKEKEGEGEREREGEGGMEEKGKEKEQEQTETEEKERSALPFRFPRVVLDHVLDILDHTRRAALASHYTYTAPAPLHLHPHAPLPPSAARVAEMDADLATMARVCREWRGAAQRALGRVLVLRCVTRGVVERALETGVVGPWTREVVVFRSRRDEDPCAGTGAGSSTGTGTGTSTVEYSHSQATAATEGEGGELWPLFAALLRRIPNVQTLTLSTDFFKVPVRPTTPSQTLRLLPSLRVLRLVQEGDISPLLGMVCRHMPEMRELRELHVQYSGAGSVYATYVSPSELAGLAPPGRLETVGLSVGEASELSLAYVRWLTQPRERDGVCTYWLQALVLDLRRVYYKETSVVAVLGPCLARLRALEICAGKGSGGESGLVAAVVGACGALRRLRVRVGDMVFGRDWFWRASRAVEDLAVAVEADEDAPWEEWDDHVCGWLERRLLLDPRLTSVHIQLHVPHRPPSVFPRSRALALAQHLLLIS